MKKILTIVIIGCALFLSIDVAQATNFSIDNYCDKKCIQGGIGGGADECGNPGQAECTPADEQKNIQCIAECKKSYADCKTANGSNGQSFCDCKFDGGIVLNTDFPFIGRCIAKSSDGGAITGIAGAFTNIFLTLIITMGFGMVIWAGVQFAMNKPAEGKKTITNVIIAFAALGSLGVILRLINPNFFK